MQTKTQKKVRIVAFMKDFIDNAQYKIVKGGQLGLSDRSLANYKNFQKIISRYEANVKSHLYFHSLNASVIEQFKRWLLVEQQYSLNHAGRLMGFLKTVAKTAANYDIDTGSCTHLIAGFSRPQKDQYINTISFEEYGRIVALKCPTDRLRNAQKWLILGFWLGQRVSDLLRLDPSWIRPAKNGGVYIDIVQQKTKKRVTIGVIDPVPLQILREEFPREIGDRCFNRYMKEVCQMAGIDQQVKGYKLNVATKRKELGTHPKYELLSSHDLRRSFATNFFGKIETPVLMQMTGHSRESTFLNYIGVGENKDIYANNFMEGLLALKTSKTY